MDEATAARLQALATRKRLPIPQLSISTEGWPPEMLAAARYVWARRVFNESGSIQIAQRLRASAPASREIELALERLEEDETAHAALAQVVLSQLGGASPELPRPAPPPTSRELEFARLVLVGLAVCETVSASRYAAVRTHTDRPAFRECIELFLRDEVVHSELGFRMLPVALERVGADSLRKDLSAIFRELDQTIGLDSERGGGLPEPRRQPANNPGVVEPAVDAQAFYDAIHSAILPQLDRLGFDASRVWAERWM